MNPEEKTDPKVQAVPKEKSTKTEITNPRDKADRQLEKIKKGDGVAKMSAAYWYRKCESWKAQGYGSLEEAIKAQENFPSYRSVLRMANATQAYREVTGEDKHIGCSESALRPLTSLDRFELNRVKAYLESKRESLRGKSKAQVEAVIVRALAAGLDPRAEGLQDVLDQLTETVMDNLSDATLTSATCKNLVADHIAKAVAVRIRQALKSAMAITKGKSS